MQDLVGHERSTLTFRVHARQGVVFYVMCLLTHGDEGLVAMGPNGIFGKAQCRRSGASERHIAEANSVSAYRMAKIYVMTIFSRAFL